MLLIHGPKPKNNWRLRYLNVILSLIYLVLLIHHWEIYMYPLRKKYQYSGFFWSVFSQIRTEYGKIRSIPQYSLRMRENTDQKNSEYGHFLHSVFLHRERCEKCSKFKNVQKHPEWRHWIRSGVFIVNFEHILHLFLVFL